MRTVTLIGLATLVGSASLAAQHGREYEFDLFGAYTKYDASFNLANKVGGGARLGFLFGKFVGAEVEVLLQPNYAVGTTGTTMEPLIAGGSLVFNLLHSERNILYVLGGYSLLDFGVTPPYQFTDGGAHAAVGDKIFFSHHVALRFEARAIYSPDTKSSFGTKAVTHLVGSAGLAIFAPGSKRTAAPPPAPPPPPVAPAPTPAPSPVPVAPPPPPPPSAPAVESLPPAPVAAAPAPPPPPPPPSAPAVESLPPAPVAAAPKCPAAPPGVPVDANGCMILFRPGALPPTRPGAPPARPTLILRGVNFETGRSVLTKDSYAALDVVAASLLVNSEIRIEIAGYTDNTGPMGANLRLSQARAAAVRHYLAMKGITPARMLIRGYGSAHPIASNNTPAGRAQNRRVELHKLP